LDAQGPESLSDCESGICISELRFSQIAHAVSAGVWWVDDCRRLQGH